VIPLLGKTQRNVSQDTIETPATNVHCSTIHKLWKPPRCPTTDEWIKTLWYIYTMEFYSSIRNNDLWFEGKWMQLEDIMLSKVSQVQETQKPHVFSHTWKIDPKMDLYTNISIIIY
jgi:hypothetical protein